MLNKVMVGSGDEVSKLAGVITQVQKKTRHFKSHLSQIQETLTKINPTYEEFEKQNQDWGRGRMHETEIFIRQLKEAEELVRKCEQIKWNIVKRVHQMYKLYDLNKSLWRYFKDYLTSQTRVNTKEISLVTKNIQAKLERGSWTCHVPVPRGIVIGFDEQVMDLKRMLLKDSSRGGVDGCHVVVISGGAGCGKTTLATMLCHDPEIEGTFGSNIYLATISNSPNLKVMIRNMLPFNPASQESDFANDKEAIARWGSFLYNLQESPVLLVLDDVWSLSIIMDFRFKLRGYKILVTSRTTLPIFNTYKLLPLADQDAINLLRYSALSQRIRQTDDDDDDEEIPEDLVYKLAMCCRKLPLALIIIGDLLCGARMGEWRLMLNKLSQGPRAVLDLEMDNIWKSQLATCLGV